jgi:hypothetical protein
MPSNLLRPRRCSICSRVLDEPGRGRWKYCKPPRDCADKARIHQVEKYLEKFYGKIPDKKAWQRAHKLLQRHGLTRRNFLATLLVSSALEAWPESRSAREERAWETLRNIRASVAVGEDSFLDDEVVALQSLVGQIDNHNSSFAKQLDGHCEAIRRDLGGPTFMRAIKLAENSTHKWTEQGEYLQAAVSMLIEANLRRIQINRGDEPPSSADLRKVKQLAHRAYTIAEGLCWRLSQQRLLSKLVRHQAMRWESRIVTVHAKEPEKAKPEIATLRRLSYELEAEGFDASRVWIDTLAEEVSYFAMLEDFQSAEARLDELRDRAQKLPSNSPYNQLSLLRTEIELLLAKGNESKAIALISVYIAGWLEHPNVQQKHAILSWAKRLGKKCPPVPEFSGDRRPVRMTGILPFFYFDDRFALF